MLHHGKVRSADIVALFVLPAVIARSFKPRKSSSGGRCVLSTFPLSRMTHVTRTPSSLSYLPFPPSNLVVCRTMSTVQSALAAGDFVRALSLLSDAFSAATVSTEAGPSSAPLSLAPREKQTLRTYIVQRWFTETASFTPELVEAVRILVLGSSGDSNAQDVTQSNPHRESHADGLAQDGDPVSEQTRMWFARACAARAGDAPDVLIPLGLDIVNARPRTVLTERQDHQKGKAEANEEEELRQVLEDKRHIHLLALAADGDLEALQAQAPRLTSEILDALPLHIKPDDVPGLIVGASVDSAWCEQRARSAESSGLRDVALDWARRAAHDTNESASRLVEQLETLSRQRLPDDWTLDRIERATEQEVLDASRDLRGLPADRLHAYLLSASLDRALEIFEQSKATLPVSERVITSDLEVARLALAKLYGSQETDRWTFMSRIFECLPVWDTQVASGTDDSEITTTTLESLAAYVEPSTDRPPPDAASMMLFFAPLPFVALSRALDILDVHLESGEILARWHVPAPLQTFLRTAFDAEEQRGWATRMARTARPRPVGDEDWISLRDDMCKLAGGGEGLLRGAFGLLDRQEVLAIFYGGLLAEGKFKLCKSLLLQSTTPLSPATLESLVLGASHEFYDNGSLSSAADVLSVAAPTQAIRHFRSFIDATRRVVNVTDLAPVEIRHTTDRLQLIRRVSHLDPDLVLEVARGLAIEGQLPVLCMIAESSPSEEIGDRIISELQQQQQQARHAKPKPSVANTWKTLAMLGQHADLDVSARARFLGRALETCPAEDIQALLISWRRVEDGQLRLSDAASYRRKAHIPEPIPLSSLARFRSASPARSDAGSTTSSVHLDGKEIRQHARKALVKGVGWLLGANETSPRL